MEDEILEAMKLTPAERQVAIETIEEMRVSLNHAMTVLERGADIKEFVLAMAGFSVPYDGLVQLFQNKIARHTVQKMTGG